MLNKSGNELLLDLINSANSTDLSLQEISFNSPQGLVDDISERNTSVQVNATVGHGYSGNVVVKYDRIELEDLTVLDAPIITIPEGGDIHALVDALNEHYQLGLSAGIDIVDTVDLTDISFTPSSIAVTAPEDSFAYKGQLDVEISWTSTNLDDVITTFNLLGLEMPPPPLAGNFVLVAVREGVSATLIPVGAAHHDGKIYDLHWDSVLISAGGLNPIYDIDSNTYTTLASAKNWGYMRADSTVTPAVFNNSLWYYGSFNNGLGSVNLTTGIITDRRSYSWDVNKDAIESRFFTYSDYLHQVYYDPGTTLVKICSFPNDIDGNPGADNGVLLGQSPIPLGTNIGSFVYGDSVYVYAGSTNSVGARRVFQFNLLTETWSELNPVPGNIDISKPREAVLDTKVYGFSHNGTQIWRYDIPTDTWEDFAEKSDGVGIASAVSDGTNVYLCYGNSAEEGTNNTLYRII